MLDSDAEKSMHVRCCLTCVYLSARNVESVEGRGLLQYCAV
jgi:hypothetical protein